MEVARMGGFVSPKSVYWHDPTNLFSKYKSTNLSKVPTFLKPIYTDTGSNKTNQLKHLFLTQFQVKCMPSLEDYVDLLCHVVLLNSMSKSPFSYEETLVDIFKIYETIVDACMEMSNAFSNEEMDDTAIVQVIHIDESVRNYLLELLKDKKFLPCLGKKWLELTNTSPPIIIDTNYDLAEKFAHKLNVIVINPTSKSDEFYEMCCRTDALNEKLMYFFHNCLRLNTFSSVLMLDLENITENLREAPDVQNACRKMLPHIQCFMYHRKEFESIYKQLVNEQISIKDNLTKLKFYRY